MMKENFIAKNPEFILTRHNDGVSISKNKNGDNRPFVANFSDLCKATVSTYFLDNEDRHLGINPTGLIIADFNSEKDAIGNTIKSTMKEKTYLVPALS